MPGDSSPQEQGAQKEGFIEAAIAAPVSEADAKTVVESSSTSTEKDAQAAGSSPAKDAKGEPSLLDVVNAALKEEKPGKSSDPKSGQEGSSEGESKAGEEASEEKPEDQPPFHEHPRWKEVQAELKELRPLKEKIAQVQPRAEAFDQLHQFATEANLGSSEVSEGFAVMRLMKNEPEKALPLLEGYVSRLKQVLGHTLSPELERKVAEGFVDETTAQQLARATASKTLAEAAAEAAKAKADSIQQQHEREALNGRITGAVKTWESSWKKSDPDYALKSPLVKQAIELAFHRGGVPQTPEAAVEIAKQSRKQVEDQLTSIVPKKPAVSTPTGGSSARAAPQPKTSLDVVNLALAGQA